MLHVYCTQERLSSVPWARLEWSKYVCFQQLTLFYEKRSTWVFFFRLCSRKLQQISARYLVKLKKCFDTGMFPEFEMKLNENVNISRTFSTVSNHIPLSSCLLLQVWMSGSKGKNLAFCYSQQVYRRRVSTSSLWRITTVLREDKPSDQQLVPCRTRVGVKLHACALHSYVVCDITHSPLRITQFSAVVWKSSCCQQK